MAPSTSPRWSSGRGDDRLDPAVAHERVALGAVLEPVVGQVIARSTRPCASTRAVPDTPAFGSSSTSLSERGVVGDGLVGLAVGPLRPPSRSGRGGRSSRPCRAGVGWRRRRRPAGSRSLSCIALTWAAISRSVRSASAVRASAVREEAQLLDQPGVRDGDGGLAGERADERGVVLVERVGRTA